MSSEITETPIRQTDPDLVTLVGSRLCHDLISPLGAMANGIELLTMKGMADSPEVQLIAQSVAATNTKLRLFRLAFGAAGDEQRIAAAEVAGLLADYTRGGRIACDWQTTDDASRAEVKLALLALMCFETALPFGGTVVFMPEPGGGWRIEASSDKIRPDPALWAVLGGAAAEIPASRVQFALLAREARAQGRRLGWQIGPAGGNIRF